MGGDYIEKNIRSLADDGRLVNIAFQNGSIATLDFMRMMLEAPDDHGLDAFIRSNEFKGHIARAIEKKVLPLIVEGKIKVPIDSTFPLERAAEAHARLESSSHIGKIVLTVA